ncbi:MAG TPA: XdhC family protein [Candidatus Hodarchaeales archaeon]|nr:XdhC family protein [Candidatus Hodarchaeales archaeon]
MSKEFFEKTRELSLSGEPFAVATVIKVEGSASAKPGAKAIIDHNGGMVFGWVGGGCAESTVRQEALDSFKDGQTRVLSLDLNDEVLGVGMPCGGMMEIFVEPFLSRPELLIFGHGRVVESLASLAHSINFSVTVNSSIATKEKFPTADFLIDKTENEDIPIGTNTYVVIATQHKGDHFYLKKALASSSPYIALVASKKRTELTFSYVLEAGVSPEELKRVRAPAGLDLGGTEPEEIALSIISEIVASHRGGSGRPLTEVKGPVLPKTQSPDQILEKPSTATL